jgi:hypothetical protein
MLHALTKKVKLHTSRVDPGAEFQDYKLRLAAVKKNISMAEQSQSQDRDELRPGATQFLQFLL